MNSAVLITVLAAVIGFADGVAVMSVDLGSEYMKIGIVKPGIPMEIVLNRDSSRKTRTLVAFRDGERQFGNQAYTTSVKFPKKSFWYLTQIIGRTFDDPQVQLYRERFPYYDLIKDEERGTVLFKSDEGEIYSPEELLGMILESAREYAEEFGDHPIKDAVITVPAYFTQAERRAVITAADLIGLNVLQLMSDNAAVALNYGVFRRKNFNSTTQYYIFYDMGASSTTATLVGYQVVKKKEGTRVETNPQVVIKGVGFDRTLGGLSLTMKLRDHLAREFNNQKKTKTDVFTNNRSMAKLLKEADRVKHVLSANNDHYAQIEGLLEENDFRAKVTREQLEEMCQDFFPRVVDPIKEALKVSEVTMDEVQEVILMGGGTRMPKVQEELQKFLGSRELGKSINTDESAAMGAVYHAAYLGKGFKVKTFNVKEGNIYPIVVEFEKHRNVEEDSEPAKMIKRTLFGRMNPFPQKKVMTFNKHFSDFSFTVVYGDLGFLSDLDKQSFPQSTLSNVSLSGVEEAYNKNKEGSEAKGIKAHFVMDGSGILKLDKVESVFEKAGSPEEEKDQSAWTKIGDAIGGLFSGAEKKDEDGSTETEEMEAPRNTTADEKSDGKEDQKSESEKKEQKEKSEKKPTEKEPETEEKKPEEKDGTKEEKKEDKEKKEKDGKDGEKKEEDKKDGEKKEKDEKPKVVTVKAEIGSSVEVKDIADHTKDKLKESKKRLAALKAKDKAKMELEKSKNELEAYIFDSQDKLTQETYEKCSTETEREELMKLMSEASDWLYEQPDDAGKEVYTNKLKSLKESMQPVTRRVFELEERPKALDALKSMMNHSVYFLKSVKNLSNTDDPMFTEVEVTTLEKLINETKEWTDTHKKEQKKLKPHENPKLVVEDIALKIQALDREVKYLVNKAKYWKPKTKPKSESKKTNTTDGKTTASNETKTEEDPSGSTETPETQEAPPTDSKTEESTKDDTKSEKDTKDAKDESKKEGEEEEVLQIDDADSKTEDKHSEL